MTALTPFGAPLGALAATIGDAAASVALGEDARER